MVLSADLYHPSKPKWYTPLTTLTILNNTIALAISNMLKT